MAVQVWDGWDHYNSTTFLADMFERSGFLQYQNYNFMNQSGGSPTYSLVSGVEGDGKALKIFIDEDIPVHYPVLACVFQQRLASAFTGTRIYIPTGGGLNLLFYDTVANEIQVSVYFNLNNYSVQVYRGAIINVTGAGTPVLLGYSANNVWTPDTFNYIEVWPVINATTGSVEVKINGQVVLNVTGVNTQQSGNAWWDALGIAPKTFGFNGNYVLVDDMYYADTTTGPGSYPCDTPLGDVHVFTKFMIGNDAVQFTPLANTNWQEISEVQFDGDLSYNFDFVVGHQDTFNAAALEATITKIVGLQLTGAYRKDDAGARSIEQVVISGGTTATGSSWSLPDTTYVYFTDKYILDPNTTASWVLANANAIHVGYKIAA